MKEEVITRLMELGVVVTNGSITFNPFILRKAEFLSNDDTLVYFDINGDQQTVALSKGQLGFTYCQVPVVYGLADGADASIVVTHADGTKHTITGDTVDAATSLLIFDKKGTVSQIDVLLTPALN